MSRLHHLVQFVVVWSCMLGTTFGQTCQSTGSVPNPDIGGAWVATAATPTCTLENGGYVKKQISSESPAYKVHLRATVTGGCQTRSNQCTALPIVCTCVDGDYQVRSLGTSELRRDGSLIDYVMAQGTVQHYDTSVPTGTTNTGDPWRPLTEGTFTFTSSIRTNATSCNLTPTASPGTPFIANVLKCKPVEGTKRFAAGTDPVQVYVPYTWAYAAVDHAISQWNAVGLGVTLERVTSSCGSGPRCVNVYGGNPTGDCGLANAETVENGEEISGNATISIWDDQQNYTEERLRRTMTHELGHLLGLGNYDCATESDAVMHEDFGNCVSSTPVATALQPSDKIPAMNAAYGGQTWAVCGF